MIISGSLHTLKKGTDDDPRRQRAISAIEGATRRGASLTNQLLTFARRQSVNPQAIDIAERINAVREVLDTGVGGAVALQFDVDRNAWPVMPHRRNPRVPAAEPVLGPFNSSFPTDFVNRFGTSPILRFPMRDSGRRGRARCQGERCPI